ncbi:MAG: tetratricopeptide repeat protein, partial [Phycisphaerae bacterium]|nr:tetratricopeptide repeat protein [Saprospiraceae bacterium]
MPTPYVFKTTLVFLFLLLQSLLLQAQGHVDPHQYDSKISSLLKKGQEEIAIYYLNKKTLLAKKTDSLALWGQTQVDIIDIIESDYKRSLAHMDAAWVNRWREPKTEEEWRPFMLVFTNKGYFLKELGQYWQANQAYETAAKYYERFQYLGFDVVYAIYKPLGSNYIRLGENDKAIAVFQKALAHGPNNEDLSGLYSNIGSAYWNKGDYLIAEENYRKGLGLSDISDAKKGLLLGRLAETMLDLGRTAEAARTATKALRLLHPEGPDDTEIFEYRARARRIAGLANTKLLKFAEAQRFIAGALADDRVSSGDTSREVGKDYIAFSKLYLRQGRILPALGAADKALSAVIPSFHPGPANPHIPKSPNPQINQFYEENTIFEALTA